MAELTGTVSFLKPRRGPQFAALQDPGRIIGILGPPRALHLGGGEQAQRIVQENPRRLGCWLQGYSQPLISSGQTTAPGAAVAITGPLVLQPGVYDVTVLLVFIGATAPVAGTDSTNMQLLLGSGVAIGAAMKGTQVGSGALTGPTAVNQPSSRTIRVIVPQPTSLQATAIAAATAGTIYQAELIVSPIDCVLIGLEKSNLGAGNLDGQIGWPVGPVPVFMPGEQELWGITDTGSQPSVLWVWEVFKEPRGRADIAADGSLPG
jgi:hypothetical protein